MIDVFAVQRKWYFENDIILEKKLCCMVHVEHGNLLFNCFDHILKSGSRL